MLRFGVIGCGAHAKKTFLPAIDRCVNSRIVAVASREESKAEELAKQFYCDAVVGYEGVLIRDDIDVVYISTPIGLHAEWILKAARSGKHVLCEKTLTTSLVDTIEAVECCRANNVALMEGFAYQYHLQHKVIKELVEEGYLGQPVLFQAWFGFPPHPSKHRYDPLLGGGALLDAGAYTIHSARQFFGREPITVSASLDRGGYEVDVHGSILLDFGEGQTALLAFGFNNMYRNAYSIWGTEGCITTQRAFSLPPDFSPSLILEKQGLRDELSVQPCDHFVRQLDEFCSGIGDANKLEAWSADAIAQARVVDVIQKTQISPRTK